VIVLTSKLLTEDRSRRETFSGSVAEGSPTTKLAIRLLLLRYLLVVMSLQWCCIALSHTIKDRGHSLPILNRWLRD